MKEETPKPEGAKRFEVKHHLDRMTGKYKKDIFIDDELFEYEIDPESVKKAKELGPMHMKQVAIELQKHFLSSLSDFLGREVTSLDVMEATKTGWI